MNTSNQRQEVAEKLRAKYHERQSEGWLEIQDVYMQRSNYLQDIIDCLPDGDSAFTVLADLIDPTCRNLRMPFAEPGYECSICHFRAEALKGYANWSYCPYCGARVVRNDE